MNLRDILIGAAIAVAAMYAVMSGVAPPGDIQEQVPSVNAQPATDEPIKVINADGPRYPNYKNITFYKSGAVAIYINPTDNCYTHIKFTHSDSSEFYRSFKKPEFEGPVVFDGKSVVQANGPYPNNKFQLVMKNEDPDYACIGANGDIGFTVPKNWSQNG